MVFTDVDRLVFAGLYHLAPGVFHALVALVRLLARQAARELIEAEGRSHPPEPAHPPLEQPQ